MANMIISSRLATATLVVVYQTKYRSRQSCSKSATTTAALTTRAASFTTIKVAKGY